MPLTTEQFDAICDAQDANPQLAELSADEAAAKLKEEGHEAFADWQPEGQAEAEQPAKARRAVDPILEEDDATPDLNAGAPQTLTEEQPKAATTTAVATREPEQKHEVARPNQGCAVEGGETLNSHDFAIPRLQLKQSQTRDDDEQGIDEIEDGLWFLSNDPEGASETRTVVFLEIRGQRSFMLPYDDDEKRYAILEELGLEDVVPDDAKVLCSSDDRILPVVRENQAWAPLSDRCETCKHGKWRKTKSGKNVVDCSESYRAILVDTTEDETPAMTFLKGSAVRPTRSLLTNLRVAAKRESRKRGERIGFYGLQVELSAKKKKGDKGTYYVPRFGRPQPLDEGEVDLFRGYREELVGGPEGEE